MFENVVERINVIIDEAVREECIPWLVREHTMTNLFQWHGAKMELFNIEYNFPFNIIKV